MFAQLDTRTVYSFMDSLVDLKTYVSKSKSLGYQTIGILDHSNLYAAYHFIQEAQKANLRPIVGFSFDIVVENRSIEVYCIAINTVGYKNLLKLSTAQMSEKMSLNLLTEHLEGVQLILPYQDVLDQLNLPFDYVIGVNLTSPQIPYTKPIIAIDTVRYFQKNDIETLQMLHAIRDNVLLKDAQYASKNQELKPCQEMTLAFKERFPEALDNLESLVENVAYHFDSDFKLPIFNREIPAGEELRTLTQNNLKSKGLWSDAYQERLEKELTIIHKMGFDDYFLIVWDLLRFGRSKGYYMGMGRGSAAGSLVSYALNITGIDPVKHNLIFERFLNEERYSMPDIDIDLPDIYRGEFLRYVRNRYGSMHSAQIVTFSTFGAKQAIRDVFKRFGASEYELTNITKKIHFRDNLTSVYNRNLAFRQIIDSKIEYQKAYDIAKRIEGNPRQTSIHAAGVVMSDDLLTDHIPLKNGEDMMITQYDASSVEDNGLLKMDFLGLRNLTFVQKMKEKVDKDYGISIQLETIDLEDKETLKLFAAGQTKGIFQFEQSGAINLLRRIRPECFEDVVATTSLNRPGASDYTENFINRRFGKEKIDLVDPVIAPILQPTYGIMLYQEQVMQIAQTYAGFTLGKSDLLRRAMSKKNSKEMQKMAQSFLEGAVANGHRQEDARLIFERMAKFAGYGFNRSHAFAYSALAFQLAYFKAHYSDVFYDIMINYSNSDYLIDAIDFGFVIEKPSINTISYRDRIYKKKIYLGLKNIKAVPNDLAYWISKNQPFQSIEDFLMRLPQQFQKSGFISPLIAIGAFDEFDNNRRKITSNLDSLFTFVNELGSLFADTSYHWLEVEDFSNSEKYEMEQDILGVGISPHPLVGISQKASRPFIPISQVQENSEATILVQLKQVKVIRTKSSGQQMAFLTVMDINSKMDITVFPETFNIVRDDLQEGKYYYLHGKIQKRDERLQMVLNGVQEATEERFWILLKNHDNDKKISEILSKYKGHIPVYLHYETTKETIQSKVHLVRKDSGLALDLSEFVVKTVYQ
ncbi:TPA: DNA polymerase III subunit alpha [Streptococcus agalactiae]